MTEEKKAPAKAAGAKDKPAKTEKPKRVQIKENGIVRPGADTVSGKVWGFADDLTKSTGKPALRKDVLASCEAAGFNMATAATQYGRWRKFNGLKGRGDSDDEGAAKKGGAKK